MTAIKSLVEVVINGVPRLVANVYGNEWPPHAHHDHTGLDDDDHLHYMTNAAGASRHHTGDVYFDSRIVGDTNLRLDDAYRAGHTVGGGDWDQDGIDLSAGPGEWQDLYDAAGGIVSIIGAITTALNGPGGSGGVTLDGAYDYGGPGVGRSVSVNSGAILFTVPNSSNNAALIITQSDTTNDPVGMEISNAGSGYSIELSGAGVKGIHSTGNMSVSSTGSLSLGGGSSLSFTDGNRTASSWPTPMPFSLSYLEWNDAWLALGSTPGSLLGLIKSYSAGGTLDNAYDFGGGGAGRIIQADSGSVVVTVADTKNNPVLELNQYDSTNNPYCLKIDNESSLHAIYLDGAGNTSITSSGYLGFADSYTEGGGSNWGWSYIPLTLSDIEWTTARALLGDTEDSLFELIFAAAAYQSGGLDEAYDYSSPGGGRSVSVDSGAVSFTVPGSGTDNALSLTNLNSANTSALLLVYNDATLSTGYAAYLDGDAGGSTTDYNELGHLIWADGSSTIGHGDTTDGVGNSRSYTNYHYREIDLSSWAAATMRADSGSSWADYAYVRVYASSTPAVQIASTGTVNIYDGYESGSSWSSSSMSWSLSSASWSSIESLISAESTEHSLLGAILAAAASGGGTVSRPDKEIVWGTGASYSSEANFSYDDDYNQVRIINNNSLTNWYDTNAASILLQGTATQGNAIVANGNVVLGSLHSTVANTASLIAKNDGAYVPTVQISALPTSGNIGGVVNILADHNEDIASGSIEIKTLGYGGEGSGGGVIDIISESESAGFGDYNSEINLRIKNTSTSYGLSIDGTGATTVLATWDCPVAFKNACWGTPTSGIVSGATLTVNFSTGKDAQKDNFSANITTLSITAPVGGYTKGLVVELYNSGASAYTVGGGTGWNGVKWSQFGTDLGSSSVSVAAGDTLIIMLIYNGSAWRGSYDMF